MIASLLSSPRHRARLKDWSVAWMAFPTCRASVPESSAETVPAWKCSEKQQSLILELVGKAGLEDSALNLSLIHI